MSSTVDSSVVATNATSDEESSSAGGNTEGVDKNKPVVWFCHMPNLAKPGQPMKGHISQIPLLNDIAPEVYKPKRPHCQTGRGDLLSYREIDAPMSSERQPYHLAEWFYHDHGSLPYEGEPNVMVPAAPDWIQHDEESYRLSEDPQGYPFRPPFSIDSDMSPPEELTSKKWRAWNSRRNNPNVPANITLPPIIGGGPDGPAGHNFSHLIAHEYQKDWILQQQRRAEELRIARKAANLKKKQQQEGLPFSRKAAQARDGQPVSTLSSKKVKQLQEEKEPFCMKRFQKVPGRTNTYRVEAAAARRADRNASKNA